MHCYEVVSAAGGAEPFDESARRRMDRLAESAPCGVVPGMHRIGRRADSRAAVPAKIEQDESRPRPRLDTHPGPFRDFPQADLPIPPPREPVSDHRLDEGCDEVGAA